MKQIFTILSVAVIAATVTVSCKTKTATTDQTNVLSAVDSAEFAAFQEWKEQQEIKKQRAATTVRYVERRQPVVNSSPAVVRNTQPAKKKWTNATKGAVIGGASGAVIGGVVSKRNRVAGVLVGGVLGAGGGWAIGRSIDKKQSNY
jgi:Glycine zipper